jgi:hypothetical protein
MGEAKRKAERRTMIDCDYEADTGERILAALTRHGGVPPQLRDAAMIAGEQLEWLKPAKLEAYDAICGQYPGLAELRETAGPGMVLGHAVASVPSGTVLVVLADTKRAVTIHVPAQQGRREAWSRLAAAGVDWVADNRPAASGDLRFITLNAMQQILEDHGRRPAQDAPVLTGSKGEWIIGMLLAGLPASQLTAIADGIEQAAERGICPVLIGLKGPASSGTPGLGSGCWPIPLLLAPYDSGNPAEQYIAGAKW